MTWPTMLTHDRLDHIGQPVIRDFERSYLGIRFLVGFLGIALPVALVVVDWWFLAETASLRGSMSAYYHSPARDLFVGGLVATGVVLCSYMSWKWHTWDFWISLVAGLAVLGVAAFPTGRADVDASPTSCEGATPPCVALQERFGEELVAQLHQVSAGVVVAMFALLSLVFALRDFGYGVAAHADRANGLGVRRVWRRVGWANLPAHLLRAPRTLLYSLCTLGVIAGAGWALLGPEEVGGAPRVYLGEFIAFTSFGCAWIVAAWDLLRLTRIPRPTWPRRPREARHGADVPVPAVVMSSSTAE